MSFERLGSLSLFCTVCSCSNTAGQVAPPAPERTPAPTQHAELGTNSGPQVRDVAEAEPIALHLTLDHPHALAFRVEGTRVDFVEACRLYTPPPKRVVSMDGTPQRAAVLLRDSSVPVGVVYPGVGLPDRRAVTFAGRRWRLPNDVLHGPGCGGVTHAMVFVREGFWIDPGPGTEFPCLSEQEFDHPNDALTTTCPREVLAIELASIRLAPAGAESEPILEPMVRISGGVFEKKRIETFWIDRDEVGDEAYARCVRAGVCIGDPSDRSSPFASGPAQCSAAEAETYCTWVGKRLPTLREWQWAARGREEGRRYPWGDELPDASRANAVDKAHALFVPTAELDPSDPRMELGWVDQRWAGMWTHIPVERGTHPRGDSRDGVRDLIGNVQEAVRLDDSHVHVGGGSHHYLPDNHNVALTGDPAEDRQLALFRKRALMPLSSEGYSPDFDLEGSFGFRCATTHEPGSPRVQAEEVDDGRHTFVRLPGLRRLADAKLECSASEASGRTWRLPNSAELERMATDLGPEAYWTESGELWQGSRPLVRPGSVRTTARVVCLSEGPTDN